MNFETKFSTTERVYKWPFSNKLNKTTEFGLFKALEFKDYNFQMFVFTIWRDFGVEKKRGRTGDYLDG